MTAIGGNVSASGVLLAGGDSGRASPIGLFVILALCVAVYFLWKSLNRHLKRVPDSFDRDTGRSGDAMPNDAMPNDAMPNDAMPNDARPNDARPHAATPDTATSETGRQDASAGPAVPGPADTQNGEG